jgi:predicted secreted hydrolase
MARRACSSAFAAKQLVFAHAAVTDVQGKRLLARPAHCTREGFDVAESRRRRHPASSCATGLCSVTRATVRKSLALRISALGLYFAPTQALLLQGIKGLSRKGPEDKQASYYYSQPQLATRGTLTLRGQRLACRAWPGWTMSGANELLHPEAVGWDWIGMNFMDGSALTAFRLRRKDGSTLWDGGSFRTSKAAPVHGQQGRE